MNDISRDSVLHTSITSSPSDYRKGEGCFFFSKRIQVPEAGTYFDLSFRFIGYPEVELGCHVGAVGKIHCSTTEQLTVLGLARLQKFSFPYVIKYLELAAKEKIPFPGHAGGTGPRAHIFMSDNYFHHPKGQYVRHIHNMAMWAKKTVEETGVTAGTTFAGTGCVIEQLIALSPSEPEKYGRVFQSEFAKNVCHGVGASMCKSIIWQTPYSVRHDKYMPYKCDNTLGAQGFSVFDSSVNPEEVTDLTKAPSCVKPIDTTVAQAS